MYFDFFDSLWTRQTSMQLGKGAGVLQGNRGKQTGYLTWRPRLGMVKR
ncbi:hypothetical protein CIPAW_15G030000 [Carya illinoinensis]|uniref:Uncharacterized protein n=1 Tax=Carya illinoinensis TaxID=32201 RepID=A0A8T1N7D1_CARIL|nr:hypothetical protein CIPAW_15G030000 [Carya illinoinensis]